MAVEDAKLPISVENSQRIGVMLGNNNGGARTIFRTVTQYNAEGPGRGVALLHHGDHDQPRRRTGGHPARRARAELHHRQRLRVRSERRRRGVAIHARGRPATPCWRAAPTRSSTRPRSPASRTRAPSRCATTSPSARAGRSTATATASCSPTARPCWWWRSWSTRARAARGSTPRSSATRRAARRSTSRRRCPTGWAPRPRCRRRMESAGVRPEEIDYVNAHATSTPLGDVNETQGIKLALGDRARRVPVSATKSMTGHLIGASGALEALVVAKTLETGIVTPDHQPRQSRSRVRPRLRAARVASRRRPDGDHATRSASAGPTRRSSCGAGTADAGARPASPPVSRGPSRSSSSSSPWSST